MRKKRTTLSPKLRQNWWIDAALGISAVLAIASSLYFLAFPVGGYQGGRNPYYDLTVIFNRKTWSILHIWFGLGMILAAVIHIIIHWKWITGTMKRTWHVVTGKRKKFGLRLTYNIFLDAVVAVSFLVCAVSGLLLMFDTSPGFTNEVFIVDRVTWDLVHTWSGVLMVISAVLHFVLHWKWVTNITEKMLGNSRSAMPDLDQTQPVQRVELISSK
jgi:cytochrome b subunit of formate dehydrogenase